MTLSLCGRSGGEYRFKVKFKLFSENQRFKLRLKTVPRIKYSVGLVQAWPKIGENYVIIEI